MLTIISLTTFSAVTLLIIGLTMTSERERVRERIERIAQPLGPEMDSVRAEMGLSFMERIIMPFLRRLANAANRLTPVSAAHGLDARLDSAGRPGRLGSMEFAGLKVLAALGLLVLAAVTTKATHFSTFSGLAVVALCALVGFIAPDVLLNSGINARRLSMRKSLADTLDLLTVSVEAGLGLDGAMQKVVEKQRGPLAEEMSRALQEMQVGKTRAEAMRDMSKRANIPELGAFVASLVQAETLGVSISKVLRVQGDTLRTRRSQLAREMASKLPVKLLFPLVFFIFPAVYVVVVAPGAIQIGRALGIIK